MNQKNKPIIVGASQFTQRWQDGKMPLEPIALCEKVAKEAFGDIQVADFQNIIDGVFVVNIFGWGYEDAPAELSQRLGTEAKKHFYSTFGGNTPQYLVNKACRELAKGDLKAVLLVGGEANYGLTKALKTGINLDWMPKKNPQYINGDNKLGASDLANNYELFLLTTAYPFFETALRAESGRSLAEHQEYIGKLYSKMAQVGSQNLFAWTQEAFSPEEIYTPSPENRYISFPYTKRMCANNNVDEACALVLTTVDEAEKWGIPREKWVYPLSGVDLQDIWDLERRPSLIESPAIRQASQLALVEAGLQLADIQAFDIYSCFPSAVQIGRKEIGLSENDERNFTLTGGLSLFGGPWNNYSMHAITTAVEKIRQNAYQNVMISALGWYITKHSIGIYGKNPNTNDWLSNDYENYQKEIDSKTLPEAIAQANGELKVLAYSLVYSGGDLPNKGIVLGELVDGKRCFAFIEANPQELLAFQNTELVGKIGKVIYNEQKKRNFVRF